MDLTRATGYVKLATARARLDNDMSDISKTAPIEDDWYAQGWDAYKRGEHIDANPYAIHTAAYQQWRYGWGSCYSERGHDEQR